MLTKSILAAGLLAAIAGTAHAGAYVEIPGEHMPDAYIVAFQAGATQATYDALRSYAGKHNFSVTAEWTNVAQGAALSDVPPEELDAIAALPGVDYVVPDTLGSSGSVQTNAPWGLDRIDSRAYQLSTTYNYAYTGKGVHIYILDEGLRQSHFEFTDGIGGKSRAHLEIDAVGDAGTGANGGDVKDHGTHVAGIAAGKTYGVAKDASVHGVRICSSGACPASAVIKGLDWVWNNGIHPGVVNMSNTHSTANPLIEAAVARVISRGFLVVAAAMNDQVDACYYSPQRIPAVYTVAAATLGDQPNNTTNQGPCVDSFAPGQTIDSAGAHSDTEVVTKDGTSMAAPFVTGVAALLLEANPGLTPAQLTDRLNLRASHGMVGLDANTTDRMVYAVPLPMTK